MGEWLHDVLFSPLGSKILGGAFLGLSFLLGRLLHAYVKHPYVRDVMLRAFGELRAVVSEVHQVYVTEVMKAKAGDGKLSPEEARLARDMAVDRFKSYMGKKGLAALARILGLKGAALDEWIGGKVEATVSELKASGMLPKGPTTGPR